MWSYALGVRPTGALTDRDRLQLHAELSATQLARAAALNFSPAPDDDASRRELHFIDACRPFGIRRLVDSAILFGSLRSFLASDARLVAHVRGRPSAAAALPVAAFLALGWAQDALTFKCFLPALASGSALGEGMRAAYSSACADALVAAAARVAALPIGAASASTEERLARREAVASIVLGKEAAAATAPALAQQARQRAAAEQQQGDPDLGGSSSGEEEAWGGGGREGEALEDRSWGAAEAEGWGAQHGAAAAEPAPLFHQRQREHQHQPDLLADSAASPYDMLFGAHAAASPQQGQPTAAAAPAHQERRASHEERRERRERRRLAAEADLR